jgi:DNA repair exonuclease SbcCD ATPase subunit
MIGNIKQIRNRLTSELAVRQSKIEELSTTKKQRGDNLILLEKTEKARAITQLVAEETQKKIEFHISNLVSMAIAAVYPDNPYEFKLRFVLRRNKTEADLIFAKGENETDDILNAGGGGPADVAAFALRIASWSLKKTRNVFILDEPFKCISLDKQEKCSEMLKEISDKLNVQIIIISHLEELVGSADKVIEVTNVDGISIVSK